MIDKVREWFRKYPLSYLMAVFIGGGVAGGTVETPSYLSKLTELPNNAQVCANWVQSKINKEEQ